MTVRDTTQRGESATNSLSPSDGGEGWGEEGPPLSSVLSPRRRSGERQKKSARQKSSWPATMWTDTDSVQIRATRPRRQFGYRQENRISLHSQCGCIVVPGK